MVNAIRELLSYFSGTLSCDTGGTNKSDIINIKENDIFNIFLLGLN
ncbi:MAG: hypothetical protein WC679_13970 [Bacteroidales bacterium]|jgi:hypothetical protein